MEIEFETEAECDTFSLPNEINELVEEVTDNSNYNMRNYWRITREFNQDWNPNLEQKQMLI